MKLPGRIAVSAGLLAIILWLLPWEVVGEAIRQLRFEVWLGVLAAFVVGHLVGILKWRGFVTAGQARLPFREAAQCYSAGLFANLCLPSIVGGDLLRMVMAGRATRRPEAAFLGGLMDRLTDVIALGLLVGVGAVMVGGQGDGVFIRLVSGMLIAGLGTGVLAVAIAGRTPLRRWPVRLRRPVGRVLVGLKHLRRRPAIAVRGLMLSLLIQGGFVLLNLVLGQAVGVTAPVGAWFLAWPLAKIVSLLPISLGGLAVREASLATLLAPFGVSLALGVTVGLLWQAILIAGGLLGGLAWWGLSRTTPIPGRPLLRRPKRLSEDLTPHA